MRIGGRQATGAEIRHSRWPSWCAVLFEKSDVRKKMWSGQRSARGLLAKPTNRPVIIYIRFFMYESNDIGKNRKANCTYVLRVQYSCGVVLVFWFWQEIIVFGVTYVLSVQYSCAVV